MNIGETVEERSRTWLCTDVGTRTCVAVCLAPISRLNDWFRGLPKDLQRRAIHENRLDPAWLNGVPVHHFLEEHVFDLPGSDAKVESD